jgi:hypothetical protein
VVGTTLIASTGSRAIGVGCSAGRVVLVRTVVIVRCLGVMRVLFTLVVMASHGILDLVDDIRHDDRLVMKGGDVNV